MVCTTDDESEVRPIRHIFLMTGADTEHPLAGGLCRAGRQGLRAHLPGSAPRRI